MSERISIMCVSGTREKLQMAAMVAAVAAAGGDEVNVFLSMNALPYFIKGHDQAMPNEGEMGELMAGKNVPPVKQLLSNAKELGGAHVHACSMAMDVLAIDEADLDEILDGPLGLTRFLSDAGNGKVMVF